jgi:hypothetical protein
MGSAAPGSVDPAVWGGAVRRGPIAARAMTPLTAAAAASAIARCQAGLLAAGAAVTTGGEAPVSDPVVAPGIASFHEASTSVRVAPAVGSAVAGADVSGASLAGAAARILAARRAETRACSGASSASASASSATLG